MIYSKVCKSILPVVLAILCVGFFVEGKGYSVPGLSPYFIAAEKMEDGVFQKILRASNFLKFKKEEGARNQVVRVLTKYKTGLAPEFRGQLAHLIVRESKKYDYDPFLLTALIITESSFNNWARSQKGALGLMQIRPQTAVALAKETRREWKGKPTLFDPGVNIALGAYYLDKLIKRFGDLDLALEAYNHGPTRLSRYLRKGKKPTKYSRRVISQYEMIRPQPIV
jgi:soluble lytic murein transglycosylase-like protein